MEEKEVLLREIHHRVKNNMQVVSSLINLQAGKIKDERVLNAFQEIRNRVMAMALIHETLYQSTSLGNIDLEHYISNLAKTLFDTYLTSSKHVTLSVTAKEIYLSLDQAVPCGLALNEILSNSLKHAFHDERPGEVQVGVEKTGKDDIVLSINDNGTGIPKTMD